MPALLTQNTLEKLCWVVHLSRCFQQTHHLEIRQTTDIQDTQPRFDTEVEKTTSRILEVSVLYNVTVSSQTRHGFPIRGYQNEPNTIGTN